MYSIRRIKKNEYTLALKKGEDVRMHMMMLSDCGARNGHICIYVRGEEKTTTSEKMIE